MNKSSNWKDNSEDEIFKDVSFFENFDNSSFETNSKLEDNLNASRGHNISALCCDEEINGYDKLTGKTWIYPTNYPVRDYQFNIIQSAILKNTLVSLPTGLGKTFIAAVVMCNFYRWYPLGKIIFTAPTRPLVAQQIDACYNIIAIPPDETIEMTGHMQINLRKAHWQKKRVFFATPQVIYNDIKSGICPADKIRCLVIDEAHRARGNYAYCQILGTLDEMGHKTYRLLALSATPGSKVEDVINVVKSLHIAHLELRTEACIDVAKYSHSRKINTVVVPLGMELSQLRQQYVEIIDVYARQLKQLNILPMNMGNLSKGRIVMMYKEFQTRDRGARHPQHNYIMKDFTLLIALYHGLELLLKHGSRVFLNFFDEHPEKTWIQSDDRLTALLERLRDDLGINPMSLNTSILPDGSIPEIPKSLRFGHPKFEKLKEIMINHFQMCRDKKQDTRAIVFCEYRESVNLVHCMLLQCRPLINSQMFVGQGASGKEGKTITSQKQQLSVMRNFRSGACNVLVATCVAEEGLDVGSVDLILCFDVSNKSPIRLVQRCGRTGRERGGQVFILVTEGREHQTLVDCMRQRDGLNQRIQQSKEVKKSLYDNNPRMVPRDFMPECQMMHITVAKKDTPKEKEAGDKNKKNQKDLRSMLLSKTASNGSTTMSKNLEADVLLTEEEFTELYPDGFKDFDYFSSPKELSYIAKDKLKVNSLMENKNEINLSSWLDWQRTLQKTVNICHSSDTEVLSSLLQYADATRFDAPVSKQNPIFNTQITATQKIMSPIKTKPQQVKKKVNKVVAKSPAKKDGDIRALFSTATKSTKDYTKVISNLGIQNDGNIPTSLINLLVELSLESSTEKKCYVCESLCKCEILKKLRIRKNKTPILLSLNEIKLPDLELLNEIDKSCFENNKNESITSLKSFDDNGNDIIQNNFDLDFEFDSPVYSNSPVDSTIEKPVDNILDRNFEIGDIDDIFDESSPEEPKEVDGKNLNCSQESLGFFGLDSIDDIFAESDEDIKIVKSPIIGQKITDTNSDRESKNIKKTVDVIQKSPSILSGSVINKNEKMLSPILCSQVKSFQLSTKKQKSLTPNLKVKRNILDSINNTITSDNSKNTASVAGTQNNISDTSNKSVFTITQLVEMINKTENTVNQTSEHQTEREDSVSPILLTQADRKKTNISAITIQTNKSTNKSLIVLDSDSDSDSTQVYDINNDKNNSLNDFNKFSPKISNNKRKLNDIYEINASPYFNKKSKIDSDVITPLTLQEKVLKAIQSDKEIFKSRDDASGYFEVSPQKENLTPQSIDDFKTNEAIINLDVFRRDKNGGGSKSFANDLGKRDFQNRSVTFDDSDDDFEDDFRNAGRSQKPKRVNAVKDILKTNHKMRKKKNKMSSFIDHEAELSSDASGVSGDELTDDSVGSIADFICDEENVTVNPNSSVDMHKHYLESIKSPVKGMFKIPQLPKKFNASVLSQFVEEDAYEIDSFCVDSHVGLTQVHEISELELAEIALEEKRSRKKRAKHKSRTFDEDDDSPVIKRRLKKARIQISSDSDSE